MVDTRARRARGRRRRLSGRGRATLAAIALLVAFAAGLLGSRLWSDGRERVRARLQAPPSTAQAATGGLPDVSSRPPQVGEAPPPLAPDEILRRLPVDPAQYDAVVGSDARLAGEGQARWVDLVTLANGDGPYEVEYAFDVELTRRILRVLDRGRVGRGHVIVLDPRSGRVIAYVSTDPEHFPPDRSYPAASLIKVVTAAAVLDHTPEEARRPCLYSGNQYRLDRSHLHRPQRGRSASLERALASSNNQCFAQLAVDTVGRDTLIETIERFGWLAAPAPGHGAGRLDEIDDEYDLAQLGCGLSGCRITALHAAKLAATLATGEQMTPWWVDAVADPLGRRMRVPPPAPPQRVIRQELATELRSMLVRTTTHGTARSAFRDRRGRPLLRDVRVAGKTGNLTGREPRGRYEWFIGAAPAERPTIALAVLQLQTDLWWSKSSEIAAGVLESIFCERGRCDAGLAARFTGDLGDAATPILLSEGS